MLKRNMNASGIFYAVGVVFSIVGATLGLLVLLYWAMLYTEQFEILVLTPAGAYWVHEPLAPLNEITPETQRVILESQLNKRLTDLS